MPLIPSMPPVEEIMHDVLVRDPYRWLEDRSLPSTEGWIRGQQQRCDSYFQECEGLPALRERVRKYFDIEVVDQPAKVGCRYFYRRRNRGQEQGCIYVRDALGRDRVLVDPSGHGPYVSVHIHRVSWDGSLLAYEMRHGGEDAKTIHLLDVATGQPMHDKIAAGYARGFAFMIDGKGFYFCHDLEHSTDHCINLHLCNDSAEDQVVFRVGRSRGSRLVLTADHIHLGAVWIRRQGGEAVADLWIAKREDTTAWQQVFERKKMPAAPILSHGRIFLVNYQESPNGRLVELTKDGDELHTIIPEQNSPIRQLVIAGDKIFVSYRNDLIPCIRSWDLQGQEREGIDVPIDGTIHLLPNLSETTAVFYRYESFSQPPVIYEHALNTGRSEVWHRQSGSFSSGHVIVQHAAFAAKDGTNIPITLVGINQVTDKNQQVPVIMTSYGGFGVPVMAQFSVLVTVMLELGAIFAMPHIRGGGDFGKAWHEAGRGMNRQVSFDDFIGAAEWLLANELIKSEQIAVFGGSNSGLLVCAAMTQRPDLFQAVLCIAPLLDMVRYESFDESSKWRHEYGSVENKDEFQALLAYSPYHHVDDLVNYPSTMFVTGDQDDRCNPAHARKMCARLQNRPAQKNSVVIDYSAERGHAPNLPVSVRIEALARRLAFLCRELHIPLPEQEGYAPVHD